MVSVAEAKEGQEISETARSERNSLQPFVSRPEGDREVDQTCSAITPFSNHVASFAFPFVHHNFEKYGTSDKLSRYSRNVVPNKMCIIPGIFLDKLLYDALTVLKRYFTNRVRKKNGSFHFLNACK